MRRIVSVDYTCSCGNKDSIKIPPKAITFTLEEKICLKCENRMDYTFKAK